MQWNNRPVLRLRAKSYDSITKILFCHSEEQSHSQEQEFRSDSCYYRRQSIVKTIIATSAYGNRSHHLRIHHARSKTETTLRAKPPTKTKTAPLCEASGEDEDEAPAKASPPTAQETSAYGRSVPKSPSNALRRPPPNLKKPTPTADHRNLHRRTPTEPPGATGQRWPAAPKHSNTL